MIYSIYKITNTCNDKFYIGCHKTEDLNDSYMGSGLLIKKAIEKYGEDSFVKEILFVFSSSQEMFSKERELIEELNPPYNIHEGGLGGWDYINQNNLKAKYKDWPESSKRSQAEAARCLGLTKDKQHFKDMSVKGQEKIKQLYPDGTFKGRKHTDETKRKIGETNKVKQKGEKNSMYGTMWITNGIDSKRIMKYDTIPNGYRKGRVMKGEANVFTQAIAKRSVSDTSA